eukprot:COSAG01_NODE_26574_length_709_cov_1.654098_1_plen_97_part_00
MTLTTISSLVSLYARMLVNATDPTAPIFGCHHRKHLGNVDIRIEICFEGALAPLITLLSEGSAKARERAACALKTLPMNDGNRAEAAMLGYSSPSR